MPGIEVVAETAKALSAPLTKLIEVVSAGCGRLYGPTDIRRRARAQGDALVIMEEAEERRSEVARRAAIRLLDVAERQQRNIDAIVENARLRLPNEVSSASVDADWAARFFGDAQNVSNERMRVLWGRLLAGEVTRPGSFSARTLTVVRDLSPSEAERFNELCMRCVRVNGRWSPVFHSLLRVEKYGFQTADILQLQAAGLLTMQTRALIESAENTVSIETRGGRRYLLNRPEVGSIMDMPLGTVALTDSGNELAELADGEERLDHVEHHLFHELAASGWTIKAEER